MNPWAAAAIGISGAIVYISGWLYLSYLCGKRHITDSETETVLFAGIMGGWPFLVIIFWACYLVDAGRKSK